jgi:RNA polymerase sigma-70 factor (ECF subfamily)
MLDTMIRDFRIWKNPRFIFDPCVNLWRTAYMLMGLDTAKTNDMPPAGTVLQPVSRPKRMKDDNGKRMLWVTHMTRIRDHQDQAAFAELFDHFAPRVKGFLIKSGANASLAEECTQEVMATCWHKAHMFDPVRASVATWIFTIARNRKIDVLRKERRPEPEELSWGVQEEPDHAEVMAIQQESELLGRAIAELPEAQRELIQKAYFGDFTHSQIAEQTGLPLGTIKSRIRLALERLRHTMK